MEKATKVHASIKSLLLRHCIIIILLFLSNIRVISAQQLSDSILSYRNPLRVGLPIIPGAISRTENGDPTGYTLDILVQALKDENIPHIWIEGAWPELYNKLLNGKIDVLPAVHVTDKRTNELDFLKYNSSNVWSELYIDRKMNYSSIKDLARKHIGLVKNDNNAQGFIDFIKGFNVPYTPIYYDSHVAALNDMKRRKLDALAAPHLNFETKYSPYIKNSGLYFNPTNVSIAFSKGQHIDIQEALNERLLTYIQDSNSIYNMSAATEGVKKPEKDGTLLSGYINLIELVLTLMFLFSMAYIYSLRKNNTLIKKELYDAKAKAEDSERLKSAFLANLSHEIRTPLNSILGFSDMLTQEGLESYEKKTYAKIIHRQNNTLLRLINDIIEISKIETGSVQIRKIHVKRLDTLISDIYDNFVSSCPASVKLVKTIELPEYATDFQLDIIRVKQIMNNLISNAIKYSNRGIIEFGCRLTPESYLEFFVKDEGIGIAESDLPNIFNRFVQFGASQKGAGLGLAICKLLAELMDGEMSVESELNKGSEFRLTLKNYQ